MKKLFFLGVLFIFCGFWVSGDTDGQEEIDFLLFLPNSSNEFVNESQAALQLDNLAKYLIGKNLVPGQICVYGYAAAVNNDIDEMALSKNRAVFVINELQKRGLPNDLFSDPVGYGSTELWGSNEDESDRSPNRRVRILVDGNLVTPVILNAVEPEIITVYTEIVPEEPVQAESGSGFPWKILLPLLAALLAIILFLLFKRRKSSAAETVQEPVPLPSPVIAPAAAAPVAPAATSKTVVDLEEEIRFRAYELSLIRNGRYGDPEGDWYAARDEVCARYEAAGYSTGLADGRWQASKTTVIH